MHTGSIEQTRDAALAESALLLLCACQSRIKVSTVAMCSGTHTCSSACASIKMRNVMRRL
jgi:hypothetical protein